MRNVAEVQQKFELEAKTRVARIAQKFKLSDDVVRELTLLTSWCWAYSRIKWLEGRNEELEEQLKNVLEFMGSWVHPDPRQGDLPRGAR